MSKNKQNYFLSARLLNDKLCFFVELSTPIRVSLVSAPRIQQNMDGKLRPVSDDCQSNASSRASTVFSYPWDLPPPLIGAPEASNPSPTDSEESLSASNNNLHLDHVKWATLHRHLSEKPLGDSVKLTLPNPSISEQVGPKGLQSGEKYSKAEQTLSLMPMAQIGSQPDFEEEVSVDWFLLPFSYIIKLILNFKMVLV